MKPEIVRISDLILPWVRDTPEHPALVDSGGAWTYAELDAAVSTAGVWLRDAGIRPGDRAVLVCDNRRAVMAALLALARLDAWAVLVNAQLSVHEIEAICRHAGARRVFYFTHPSPRSDAQARQFGAEFLDVPALGRIGVTPLVEDATPEPLASDVADRVATLLYTSGTTGRPKGVMLTHRGLVFAALAAARIRNFSPEDQLLCVLPLAHLPGLNLVTLAGLASGATVHILPRFDPAAVMREMAARRITVLIGVPSIFAHLLDYASLRNYIPRQFPALRLLSSCSSPLLPPIKAGVENLFGLILHNGYGATECSPGISATRLDQPRADTSVGPAYPEVELVFMSPDRQPVPAGEPGEVWVRGPNVMKGYYRAPDETAQVLDSAGWYHTGDLARIENGNVYILGRTKELIIRFGFNVYPAEVESALETHPGVARAAVVGRNIAESEGGEDIVAFVQIRPEVKSSVQEIVAYLESRLAPYKRPTRILPVEEWPLTPTGKIRKSELLKKIEHASAGPLAV